MDELVFGWLNGLAGHWPLLDGLMVGLAEWPVVAGPLVLFWLWLFGGRDGRVVAVLVAMAGLLALGVCDLPSLLYHRPRPFEVLAATVLVRQVELPSFPSTHTAGAAALAVALGAHLGRWRWMAWGLVFGLMVARVYVGVHYPTDVVGGLAVGWLTGAVIYHNQDVLRPFALRVVAFGEELL